MSHWFVCNVAVAFWFTGVRINKDDKDCMDLFIQLSASVCKQKHRRGGQSASTEPVEEEYCFSEEDKTDSLSKREIEIKWKHRLIEA